MRTMDLHEAAVFLRMPPAVLRLHARQGRVKAAKPGKRWVFLEEDLAAYLGQLYAARRQAPLSGSNLEESIWGYTNAALSGGSTSPRRMASEYAALLGLKTERSRRSITTGSRSASGKSKGSGSDPSAVGRTPPSDG
ncbi:helix-turn-helix domain-containing protein [Marilutibacter spongiae]|uniref:helix-turn-helix domain-containing protein n=1 Tax=Marilutibacter spongiae TaxID=2025720 RepID=UPI003CCCE9A5